MKKRLNIKLAIKKPGALRKTAKVKQGEKIPLSTLKKLEHSQNKKTAKRARLAMTLRKISSRNKKH